MFLGISIALGVLLFLTFCVCLLPFMRQQMWWKILSAMILFYVIIMGFLAKVPAMDLLNESIRALHFHVPMWFGMIILFLASMVYSILYLVKGKLRYDTMAQSTASVGLLFGILGLVTGMIWAQYTWGAYWNGDPKQNVSAISLLIYFAYGVLRSSIPDLEKRARLSGVYNIFAFFAMIPLIFVVPRLYDSLHPSNGGNQGFVAYDLDNGLRMIFYPAVIAWTLLGFWMSSLMVRMQLVKYKMLGVLEN